MNLLSTAPPICEDDLIKSQKSVSIMNLYLKEPYVSASQMIKLEVN